MTIAALFLLVMFVLVMGAILTGMPAMVAISGVPLVVALLAALAGVFDLSILTALPQRIYGIMNNVLFIAVPLFVFMGVLMERSQLATKMLTAFAGLAGNSPLKTSLGVMVLSTLLAASTGVVGATIIMLGLVALPSLLQANMPRHMASGMVCASGTLGQIIPPSIVLIVLADQISNAHLAAQRQAGSFSPQPVTVSDLFAAALIPGLLLVGLYAAYVVFRLLWSKPVHMPVEEPYARQAQAPKLVLFFPLFLILAVLGSILAGIATATEAAALGAGGMLLLAAISQKGSGFMVSVFASLKETALVTGMIFGIVVAASILSLVFRGLGGDEIVGDFLASLPGEKWGAIFFVMLVIFLLGFVLEFVEIIFITVPLVGPVLFAMDVNPLWFAVLMALNLQTSFLTPPFGVALFYFRDVAPKDLATAEIYGGVVPFVVLQLLALCLVVLWPQLALWLPQILFG